jgi:hypothetical protein
VERQAIVLSGWKNFITRRNLMLRMVLFKGLRLTELGDVTKGLTSELGRDGDWLGRTHGELR